MDPKHSSGGDPTDLGWATTNNSRPVNDTAKQDSDSSGSTNPIGGPHPNVMPSLFADGHVQNLPSSWAHWAKAWAFTNTTPFTLP
jgi:prepilin-type processing-associated H-X9-DG protein